MNIRLIAVIWGTEFVSMFLRTGLRSLLAEGNLPDLARAHRVVFTIYTTEPDARAIEASPAFAELRESVDVRFSFFTAADIDSANYGSHNILWERALDVARQNREILFFLIPDLLYAKNTLVRWAARFEAGCHALYTPGPQVVLETILPEIETRFPVDASIISLNNQDITSLLLRHLHPMHCGMMRNSPRRIPFPEYDIRSVAGRGFVLRELSANPFALDPSHFDSLVNFSPADHLDAVATEPCSVLSVEPLFKRIEWYYRPWCLDATRVSQIGGWWNFFTPPGCAKDSETAHEFCLNNDHVWQAGRARAAAGGRLFRAQVIVSSRIYRLITELQKLGLGRSAALLATALYATNLRRRIGLRGGETLLVPQDGAYDKAGAAQLWDLLAPGRERDLVDLVRDHVLLPAEGAEALPARKTARGLPLGPLASGMNLIHGPVMIGGFPVYVIDRVLQRGGAALTRPPRPLVGLWGYSAWARRTPAHRVAYLALHVPLLECVISLLLLPPHLRRQLRLILSEGYQHLTRLITGKPRFPGADLRQAALNLRASVKSFCIALAPVPVLGRPAKFLLRMPAEARAARMQAATPVANSLPEFSEAASTPVLPRPATQSLFSRGLRFVQMYGFRAALQRTLAWLQRRAGGPGALRPDAGRTPAVAADSLATFREVRLARGLLAMESALDYYAGETLPPGLSSAPLGLVRERIAANRLNGNAADLAVEQSLLALVEAYPRWAECWLELGHLRQDQGRIEEALEYYGRAVDGEPLSSLTGQCLDPRAEACTARARIFSARNRLEDAIGAYSASFAIAPHQPIASIEYGRLLRKTGRWRACVDYFAAGVHYEETRYCIQGAGRNAASLAFTRLATGSGPASAARQAPCT